MFQKILKLFGLKKSLTADQILRYPKPRQYSRDEHNIRVADIDPDAVKTLQRIHQMGCRAYIVGGSVRDLLLGRKPKDYDVVTDAHPQELRRMFANSRIIGRRFRLVHVVFRGNKIIEVSTARSLPSNRAEAKNSDELYLKRDNQFGTFKEDAARRDFTINALIFDIKNEMIVDYTGGFEDIQNRVVRVIGNPDISFPEDPVRMYRAVKFAALLGLDLDGATFKAIQKYKGLLKKASTSRLHEEYNKIFRSGQAATIFASLNNSGLMETLMPAVVRGEGLTHDISDEDFMELPLGRRLAIADRMIQEHEDVNLNIYYALLIAGSLQDIILKNQRDHEKTLERKLHGPLQALQKDVQLTKREYETLMQIFSTQNLFRRNVAERKGWVKEFQQRKIFQESFIVYKIIARAAGDEDALQKALFWEIGLRQKLPESIRKNSVERLEIDEKDYVAETPRHENHREREPQHQNAEPGKRGGRGRRRRGRRGGRGGGNRQENPAQPTHATADNP
ncbi:MAG: polynucleotide adenylyltransferase PcnB [Turneriella sp.]|nr:polynucleotide adenylyltransferase PcnB [Turneriella sp.]